MRKRTTTSRINAVLSVLQAAKTECYNKTTHKTTILDASTFSENLQFLNESGILADCMSWTYEKSNGANGEYIIETGRYNPESDNIVTVYIHVCDGVSLDVLEEMLTVNEE